MKTKVQKKNLAGEVTYQYEGVLLKCDENSVTLEAFFEGDDRPYMDTTLKRGDRFVEHYYSDRWYNIFAIYDRDDGHIKGWYCNVGKPAIIEDGVVSYVDLALDLWVSADGKQTVLDEDEFEALGLPAELKDNAFAGLADLKQIFLNNKPPR